MAAIITSCAEKADGLEHVTLHKGPTRDLTLGLFMLADRLAEAEDSAGRLVRRAVADHPDLHGFRVVTAEAVLVPGPWWES
ncbi:hypothetical protein ACIRU3_04570 [Streptomyces sp. NPDC101151]|uniref:hypothetical protein n=1 Tax=Streptomyces sp. NPDC101151 TaxID=3366115 RepID=UPI00380AA029